MQAVETRVVPDPDLGERALQHRQVELDVVRGEDRADEHPDEHARDLTEARRRGDVLVRDPVHRGRVGRNRPRRPDEARVAQRLAPVGPEPHDRDRNDLVGDRVRPGRLAVEGRVGKRCASPPTAGESSPC